MEWLEFAARLTEALAWPLAALAGILLLRQPLSRLLSSQRVKRLKAGPGGVELEYWDAAVEEAKNELAADVRRERTLPKVVGAPEEEVAGRPFREEMRTLARIAPRAVVLESFSRLEQLLRTELGVEVAPSRSGFVSIRTLGRLAEERRLLTPRERAVLEDLIPLRNAAAHSAADDLDEARAIEFSELVRQLIIAVLLAQGKTASTSAAPDL